MVGPRCLRYRKQSAFLTMTACGAAVLCLYMSLASLAPLVPSASTLTLPPRHPSDAGMGPRGSPRGGGGLPTAVYHHRALQNSRAVESVDGGRERVNNSPYHSTQPRDANRGGAAAKPEGVRQGEREAETGGRSEGMQTEGGASAPAFHGKSDLTKEGVTVNDLSHPLAAAREEVNIIGDTEAFYSVPGGEDSFHQVPDRTVRLHRVPSRSFHNDHSANHDQIDQVPGGEDDHYASVKLTDSVPRDHSVNTADNHDNEDAHADHVRRDDVSTVPTPHRAALGTGAVVGREGEGANVADRRINSRSGGKPTTNSSLTSDTVIYVDEEGEGWREGEGEGEEYPMEGPHAPRPLGAVRRLPRALIIGVKKAGTRALLEFLRIHPDVRAPGPEPHFFDKHYHLGLEWYRKQMPPSLKGQLTIEKTPSYYVTREVPKRIYNMSKDVKLIVVVRDPVVRAISDYTQGASKRPDIPPFEQMAFVDNSTRLVDTKWGAVRIGVYAKHLERWLPYFPLDHIHFVSGERLIADPAEEVGKVQDFLGLPRLVTAKHFYLNETRGFPCIIKPGGSGRPHCLGKTKGRTHPNVPSDVLKRLRDFFRPFNLKFYQMTRQDFGWT